MKNFADWHCDTASAIFEKKEKIFDTDGHINLKMLEKYNSPIQTFAVWLKKEYYIQAFKKTNEIINYLKNEINLNSDKIALVKGFEDIDKNKGKISAILAIEGCEALEGDMNNLYALYDAGVRVATLTWNYKNCVATGVMESIMGGGLTDFGKAAVKEMESLGIVIDVSHISDEGFFDVERNTTKPFIASHSNCRSICSFPRNLTDDQLKIIGEREGIVGLNMCVDFLSDRGHADIDDILKHTEHMLDTCGENSISLGCDFDGIPITPEGMENVSKLDGLIKIFEMEFGPEIADKIAFRNFVRIIKNL
ncbi:hypothetical protein IMSAG049_00862 [Clostridiales bacterium]|nr:hypothetical protein IMSAG049_00862 [Clostridiales bacterium]